MSGYRALNASQDAGKGYTPPDRPLGFAADWEVIPVASGELMRLIGWYPVGFQREGDQYRLGMPARSGATHALINPLTGKWFGNQLPASLRLYPFQLINNSPKDGKSTKPLLAIHTDAETELCPEVGDGLHQAAV